jgi:chemotaxis protein methyltransferase CheR
MSARMTNRTCTEFLQWALPQLGRRWAGYRKVQALVCRRLARRVRALRLADLDAYRSLLESHPAEWDEVDALLGIPISRFYRERGVFDSIGSDVLPALARAAREAVRPTLDCWSAGCASGEEPYTLTLLWRLHVQAAFPGLALHVVATDADAGLVERARAGCYLASSLKELPPDLRAAAFEARGEEWCLRPEFRAVEFLHQDLRATMPAGPFDLVLCRNVVATYYAPEVQRAIMTRIADRLRPGGALVLGIHEALPEGLAGFVAWPGARAVYRRTGE